MALEMNSMTNNQPAALLLIDMQNDYFPGGAMELWLAEEAAANAARVLDYFRRRQWPVVHIQHIALQAGADFFLPDSPGAEIYPALAPLSTEKLITKHYPNSFRDTELLGYLQNRGISQLLIAGMMTDVCVAASTRAAMDFGFENFLLADAIATRDRELNGKNIPAAQVNESVLAGLNALGGLYAKLTTSEAYKD